VILTIAIVSAENGPRTLEFDPRTGEPFSQIFRGISPPPPEVLELVGKDPNQIGELLDLWKKLDESTRHSAIEYSKCKKSLIDLEQKLKQANEEKAEKLAEYNYTRNNLRAMLLAALGRLGLQTTVVVSDGLSDLQLAFKKLREFRESGPKIRADMKKARLLGEFEALKEKAVQLRRQAVKQSLYIQSLEQAIEKPISERKPVKKYSTKKMENRFIEEDKWRGVDHLKDASQRQQYMVSARDGKLIGADGRPLDTSLAVPMKYGSPTGRGIYVMDEAGNIYINEIPNYRFKHSSFLNKGEIAAAGEITIKDGKLIYINANSGHYLPEDRLFLNQILNQLQEMGIDISDVKIEYFR